MVDGIKCACFGLRAEYWVKNKLLDFGTLISEETGELLSQRKTAEYNGLYFSISKTANGNTFCTFTGSLHRYKNGGGLNSDKFTFAELQNVLSELQTNYKINLSAAAIQSLEIGINIPLEYAPEIIIKSAICHKGRAFSWLYADNKRVGKLGVYTDYTIKLYDKGQQSETHANILRFEVKTARQRTLQPYGIKTLADLTDKKKCFCLLALLLEKISNIIFFDFSFKGKDLTNIKRLAFKEYSNANYWENLTKHALQKARLKYAEKMKKYNCINWQKWLYQTATKIWFNLFGLQAENGRPFPHILDIMQAQKEATFSTLEYVMEKVAQSGTRGDFLKSEKKEVENNEKSRIKTATKNKHYCIICGRDITQQKANSRFCSELYFGKEAKKCRNKDSNRRLAIKRKIKRAMKNDFYLKITYEHNGEIYTDTLTAKELNVTREWLNKIISVTTIKEPPTEIKGVKAQNFIKKITQKNKKNETIN